MSPDKKSCGCWNGLKALLPVFLAVIFNLFGGGPVRANLVINPTFDSSITTHLNAAIIENTISNVIAVYQASFSDPVTVAITFYANENISLGASSTWYQGNVSYSSIRSNLLAGATTVNDFTALAHLRNTTTNPVNGSTTMELTLPNGRALGFAGNFWRCSGRFFSRGLMHCGGTTNQAMDGP